jgi:hypothetical protein
MNRRARALATLLLILLVSGIGYRPGAAQSGLTPVAYLPLVLRAAPPMPFGYGIQAHAIDDTQHVVDVMQDLGFGWIKQQIRWEHVERAMTAMTGETRIASSMWRARRGSRSCLA